jgi:uncharacterized protein YbbK (DUF523 family)
MASHLVRKPLVGVSRCLLGDAVRYDGASKPDAIIGELGELFELIAVCPEVEAGLGIPRPPVQLSGDIDSPRMTGRDDSSVDVTAAIEAWCELKLPELACLHGFIFKSRSPSCGLGTVPHFIHGRVVSESADGLFAHQFSRHYPHIAIIDDTALTDTGQREHFVQRVLESAT